MAIVLMIGPPGAGKGTQCKLLEEKLGWVQISTGDVLRGHIRKETPLGLQAKVFVDGGNLVPDELLVALLQDYFAEVGDKTILLDGYPRNVNQCKNLATMEDQYLVAAAVHLDVDLEEVKKRLANRALIEGRSDDTPEKIANRLGVYAQQTYPLLDYYKEQGKLLKVNGDQKPEAVFKDLLAVFQKEGLV